MFSKNTPKFNIPSGNITKLFNSEFNTPSPFTKPTIVVPAPEPKHDAALIPLNNPLQSLPAQQPHTPQTSEINIKAEFEYLVKEKLGKIDDILVALKEKQDALTTETENLKKNPNPVIPTPTPTFVVEPEKKKRTKKSYYTVTDNMWDIVKQKFPDLSDKYRKDTYSDGTDYYVDIKNKKTFLDNKCVLKLLNKNK
jgi:hypothetical protein